MDSQYDDTKGCRELPHNRGAKKIPDMEKQIAYLSEKFGAEISLLPIKHIDISSSMIREKVALGESVRYILPEKVRQYVLKNGLYIKNEDEV